MSYCKLHHYAASYCHVTPSPLAHTGNLGPMVWALLGIVGLALGAGLIREQL